MAVVVSVKLPGYSIDKEPNYSLGHQVDKAIKKNFDINRIVIRAISLADHPKFSMDELVDIILKTGTDKYDPNRKGVSHEEFEPYNADFQAGTWEVDEKTGSMFADIMRNFYENAPRDRGYPLRIDLLLIYDINQLVQARKVDDARPSVIPRLEKYLFRFKNQKKKARALIGIVKILK